MIFKTIKLLIILTTSDTVKAQFSCKNSHGKGVDWFVIYKMPRQKSQIYMGATSYYADKESNEWSLPENLKSSKNAVAITLKQYYDKNKGSFSFFYNDQKPGENRSYGNRGHAKGVAFFGYTSGFWLIHSVPRFPSIRKYLYPKNGEIYGQSFLCITMKTESVEIFAKAMKYIDPAVYHINMPQNFSDRFPLLKDLTILKRKNNRKDSRSASLIQTFNSSGGLKFYDFSKTRKYTGDLYLDLIAKQMGISLFTETWMNGGAKDLESKCSTTQKVINIQQLKVAGIKFSNSKDHSKWAVAGKETNPLVCIADINRQESQKKRGGGALCFENSKIWKLYRKAILDVEDCKV